MKVWFDKRHGEWDGYFLGSMAKHNVVIAVVGSSPGSVAAISTIRDLKEDFPNIELGLLIGIGGGVPSANNDIRLGDVVVGLPRDNYPGAIAVDNGKCLEGNNFQLSGSLCRLPNRLLGTLKAIETETQTCSAKLYEHIQEVVKLHPKYKYPGQQLDVLTSAPCDECSDACCSHIPARQARNSEHPHVHMGTIGCTNAVVKDSRRRDDLRKRYGILCIEMEAEGALGSNIPFIVIRGIADYADSAKNDDWHDYASLAAATFAKVFLGRYRGATRNGCARRPAKRRSSGSDAFEGNVRKKPY